MQDDDLCVIWHEIIYLYHVVVLPTSSLTEKQKTNRCILKFNSVNKQRVIPVQTRRGQIDVLHQSATPPPLSLRLYTTNNVETARI